LVGFERYVYRCYYSYFKIIGILLVNRRYRNETVVVESLEWCHFFCNVNIF